MTYADAFNDKRGAPPGTPIYCAIDHCDDEAVLLTEETLFPLCFCCGQAFQLGQESPRALYDVEQECAR